MYGFEEVKYLCSELCEEIWYEVVREVGEVTSGFVIKSLNYLSLVQPGTCKSAFSKLGLAPKVVDLVEYLREHGMNPYTAANLSWVVQVDAVGNGVTDAYLVMSERFGAGHLACVDLDALRSVDMRVGPAAVAEVWSRVLALGFHGELRESVVDGAVLEKLPASGRDGEIVEVVVNEIVDALSSDLGGFGESIVGHLRAVLHVLGVGLSDEEMSDEVLGARVGGIHCTSLLEMARSLAYLAAFGVSDRAEVFQSLGFNPGVVELSRAGTKFGFAPSVSDQLQWCEYQGRLALVAAGGSCGGWPLDALGSVDGCGSSSSVDRGSGQCDPQVFESSECGSVVVSEVRGEDGLCYSDVFKPSCKSEVEEDLGSWPTLEEYVASARDVGKLDVGKAKTMYIRGTGDGFAHVSKDPVGGIAVMDLLLAVGRGVTPWFCKNSLANVRVGGLAHSSRVVVEPGGELPFETPFEFELGESVGVVSGKKPWSMLPVVEGLVIVALTVEERVRAESDFYDIDVPVLLMSQVSQCYYKHMWLVRYDKSGMCDDQTVECEFTLVGETSGFTFAYIRGPKFAGFDSEVGVWCKAGASGLGIFPIS